MKKALITGITGQDGAYLAKLLLEKGYEVWGAYRRSASLNLWRLEELGLRDDVRLIPLDLLEYSNIMRALEKVQPDEIYNLAAQSFVALSFEMPLYTADADALGVTRLLEALRAVKPDARFYQASTSEMYGKVQGFPRPNRPPFIPVLPTRLPNYTPTGSRSTTESPMAFMPPQGSSSTMSHPYGVRSS